MYRSNGVAPPQPPPVVGGELEMVYLSPRERWLLLKLRELTGNGRPTTLVLVVEEGGQISVACATPKGRR
jgi:hypothetical protein